MIHHRGHNTNGGTPPGVVGNRAKKGLAALILVASLGACSKGTETPEPVATPADNAAATPPEALPTKRTSRDLVAQRRELDQTIWAKELLAQRYGRIFVELADDLRTASDKYAVLGRFPFERLILGTLLKPEPRDLGVFVTRCGEPRKEYTPAAWRDLLATFGRYGLEVVQTEWHHVKFEPAAGGAARSEFEIVLHVASAERRIIARGKLTVEWSKERDERGVPLPATIDATAIELIDRRGEAPFKERLAVDLVEKNEPAPARAHPLIVYDLDGDGLSEIILAGWNRIYWNRGGGKFEWQPFCEFPRRIAPTGIVADFTGDGQADFVCVGLDRTVYIYQGNPGGRFTVRSRPCWSGKLDNPSVLAAGDYDRDGDLDLWLAQYKSAYGGGQMPTPYYDANDGYPAFLLRNDGEANFTDVTEEAGLAPKRFRRTYSSSFVDLDLDGDLDLLVVSDFSGVDLYLGDGRGRFTDVTARIDGERHAAGMAHTIADFDLDGKPDFYVIGMSSATVRRLDQLGLGRKEFPERDRMRGRLTYGNRMYLSRIVDSGDVRFEELGLKAGVARTGWSWGASSFDFDNDGDPDLYVANGNITGRSAMDYCTEFWRHDVYLGDSQPDPELEAYFTWALGSLKRGEISWNGFEHNALLVNDRGRDFLDVAFLMGTAHEFDARGVVTDDLDGDGRVDLVVTEERTVELRPERQVLHVMQNRLRTSNHWLGVRLREEGAGFSPVGARITVKSKRGLQSAQLVTGDSLLSQHATTLHFGLGAVDEVEWVEVRWAGGAVKRLAKPRIDGYLDVRGRTP